MKNALVITWLIIISFCVFETSYAQKKTCACKGLEGSTCTGTVSCTHGCSAICGRKDTCYLSCSARVYRQNLNLNFTRQTSTDIATTLAKESKLRIRFKANSDTEKELYDYKLVNSDVWKLLEFLDARGTLVVNGIDFENLRVIKNQLRAGEKLAGVTFDNTLIEEAVANLELMTGEDLRIVSGKRTKRVSISIENVSLTDVLKEIRKETGVRIVIRS